MQSNSPTVLVKGGSFKSNTAVKGGAIGTLSYYLGQALSIESVDFDSNIAYQRGGAVSIRSSNDAAVDVSTLDVSGSKFKDNLVFKKNSGVAYSDTYGGGAIHTSSATACSASDEDSCPRLDTTISACEFIDSGSWANGGALFLSATSSYTTTISDGTVFTGSNASHDGNDIYLAAGGTPTCSATACDAGTYINKTFDADCWDASDGEACSCSYATICADCEVILMTRCPLSRLSPACLNIVGLDCALSYLLACLLARPLSLSLSLSHTHT